ncbi:MAG: FAD:protein FMN transferase [Pirellulales bacterium]
MSQPKSTRRSFLRGGAAVEALAAWADGAAVETRLAEPIGDGYLVEFSRQAMATTFQVLLNARQYPQGADAAVAALDAIEALENQLTVYRQHSEVMHINREAYAGPVAVESRLFELFEQAARLHGETQRAFDITAGPLAKVWGFYRRQGAIPSTDDLATALDRVGMRHVLLDADAESVQFAIDGVEINLGAIGKGYALDRAAELLGAAGVEDFVLHGGASSVLARGSRNSGHARGESSGEAADGVGTSAAGWQIGIGDPQRPGERLAMVDLRDRAVGTSGAAFQFFRHQGRRYGHKIDPRTGWPAEGVLSATVVAPTAAEADALSTALYVLGVEEAERLVAQRAGTSAILVVPAERSGEVRVLAFGFAEGEVSLPGEA